MVKSIFTRKRSNFIQCKQISQLKTMNYKINEFYMIYLSLHQVYTKQSHMYGLNASICFKIVQSYYVFIVRFFTVNGYENLM